MAGDFLMNIGQRSRNRLILFGICDELKLFNWDIDRDLILAITDIKSELYHKVFNYNSFNNIIFNGNVSSIDEICQMNFDYIVVTDYNILGQAHKLLEERGIPEERIIMYDYYVQCIREHTFYSVQEESQLLKLFYFIKVHSIIDFDLFFTDKYRFSREYADMSFPPNMQVDAYAYDKCDLFPIYKNVYREIYKNFRDFSFKTYDVAFFSDYRTLQGYMDAFNSAKNIANNIIFRFRPNSIEYQEFTQIDFSAWGKKQYANFGSSWLTMISKNHNDDMKIFIVTHKPYNIPIVGKIYQPIQAGKKVNPPLEYPGDDTGDSISELNPYINELTALYWIWKNTSYEYVGLVHYRRYFLSAPMTKGMTNIPILTEQQVRDILKDHDIILRFKLYERSDSIKRNLILGFGVDLQKRSYETLLKWMTLRQPDYVPSFKFILGNTGMFICNMFVTKKKIIDAYCEWLFSFLLDAVKDFDFNGLEGSAVRIMGYYGEILFSVWIIKQNLKIKQLPWWMPPPKMTNQ